MTGKPIRVSICPEHGPREVLRDGQKVPPYCTYFVTNAQCRRRLTEATYVEQVQMVEEATT